MTIITKPPTSPAAPKDLTEKAKIDPSAPIELTEEAVNDPVAPKDLTEKAVGTIALAKNLTEKAPISPIAPIELTEEVVGTIALAKNLTEKAATSPAAPTTLTEKAVGTIATPINLTEKAPVSPVAPIELTEQPASAVPRALTPLVDMHFFSDDYSQNGNPVLFDDLFTYSRNSNASFINRRIDSKGKFEYFLDTDVVGLVTNLLTFSEDFNGVDWTSEQASITSKADFFTTLGVFADKLIVNTSNNNHRVVQDIDWVSGTTYTLSVSAKRDGYRYLALALPPQAFPFQRDAVFDLQAGVISGLDNDLEASISFQGDGIYLCSISSVANNTATAEAIIGVQESGGTGDIQFTGDGVSGIFITQAQLTESLKILPYVKSISSSTSETFVEALRLEFDPITDESLGALIEGGSTNLAIRSEELDDAVYTKTNVTIVTNDAIAPDGTTSADVMVEDATGGGVNKKLEVSHTFLATDYSLSIYAKPGDRVNIGLRMNDGSNETGVVFSMLTGEVIATLTSAPDSTSAVELDDGWWRFTITKSRVAAAGDFEILMADDTGSVTYTTTGGQTVKVWGVQLEELPLASSYIRTEGSAVTRAADALTIPAAGNFTSDDMTTAIIFKYNNVLGIAGNTRLAFKVANATASFVELGLSSSDIFEYFHGTLGIDIENPLTVSDIDIKMVYNKNANTQTVYFNSDIGVSSSAGSIPFEVLASGNIGIGLSSNGTTGHVFGHIKKFSTYEESMTALEVSLL